LGTVSVEVPTLIAHLGTAIILTQGLKAKYLIYPSVDDVFQLLLLTKLQRMALAILKQQNDSIGEEQNLHSPQLYMLLCWRLQSSPPPPPEQPTGLRQLHQQNQQRLRSQSLAF
jgi:hypothetical protein